MATATLDRDPMVISPPQRDKTVRWVALVASLLSVASFTYFFQKGVILAYKDGISHLEIASRTLNNPSGGMSFAQLGGVWLPLPHLLSLPFVWIDPLYFNGFAGSIVSMVAYVITSALLYKIVVDLTGHKLAGIVGALVFMLNPNVLYMQSTPMTELLLFACMAGMVYGAQRWIKTDRFGYLIGAGLAGLAGCLTRYEAWVLFAVLTVLIGIMGWRSKFEGRKIEGTVIAFAIIGGIAISGWMLWNLIIFGNPLSFQVGEYAKPSLWVGSGEPSLGHPLVALRTYTIATVSNLWLPIAVLAVIGLIGYIVRERLSAHSLPVLSLLTLFPFFVFALYSGQRPLHVEQISGDLYNVRFGLLMVLPAAVLIGYLSSLLTSRIYTQMASVVIIGFVVMFGLWTATDTSNVVTLKEPVVALDTSYSTDSSEASAYLKEHYEGGLVLMESFGNELVLFEAGIPTGANLYEGSYQLWEPALAHPAGSDIQWIVMRHTDQPDEVYTTLDGSPELDGYTLAFQNNSYYVFEEKP